MTKNKGFFSKLKDSFPVSRVESRRRAHREMIKAARVQVTKGVMLGLTHANAQKHEPLEKPAQAWWKAETAKWETVWGMLNDASSDLTDFRKISELGAVGDAAFKLYEQLLIDSMTSLSEVPSELLREEAMRWRETATLISSLHRHCIMDRLDEASQGGKNPVVSGINIKEAI